MNACWHWLQVNGLLSRCRSGERLPGKTMIRYLHFRGEQQPDCADPALSGVGTGTGATARPGGSWLVLKGRRLAAAAVRHSARQTIYLSVGKHVHAAYFAEGVMRATGRFGVSQWLAGVEIALEHTVFGCAIFYARLHRPGSQSSLSRVGFQQDQPKPGGRVDIVYPVCQHRPQTPPVSTPECIAASRSGAEVQSTVPLRPSCHWTSAQDIAPHPVGRP